MQNRTAALSTSRTCSTIKLWDRIKLIFVISKIFKCAFFILFMARGNGRTLIFVLYAILGLYLLNVGLQFVNLPEFFLKLNKWIVIIGGGLLIFESLKFLGAKRVAVR